MGMVDLFDPVLAFSSNKVCIDFRYIYIILIILEVLPVVQESFPFNLFNVSTFFIEEIGRDLLKISLTLVSFDSLWLGF